VCGNIVEVLQSGKGSLTCCFEHMTRLEEEHTDKEREKHVPAIEQNIWWTPAS
jgi:superoxide reductase